MKILFIVCMASVTFRTCESGEPIVFDGLVIKLDVTDTTGRESRQFRPGESFDLRFSMTNMTGTPLSYEHTGPEVVLLVMAGDSLVASSVDGLMWVQVVQAGSLRNGDSFSLTWRAPNTPWTGRVISLDPGRYTAAVSVRARFDGVTPPVVTPIAFTVQ